MLRRLFWIVLGAMGALQADRWLRQKRSQLTPNAITGTMLDKINQRLESNRARTQSRY
ncbi:hypothetical protein BH20ACT21_BH20ACT21_16230 [soil metagenome]|jgi:hypothetical protein|nr:hypothetical protein [Actinomycetota bacterium]